MRKILRNKRDKAAFSKRTLTARPTFKPEAIERRILLSGSVLNSISFPPDFSGGAEPMSQLVMDSSGNLFGTTANSDGGGNGTVFEIAHGTTAIQYIARFNGIDGANPLAGVVLDASGDLIGTTSSGGSSNDGTVFEIVHGTTSIITVATFNGTNGANPEVGLSIDKSGDLFGVTPVGENGSNATVFEVAHGSSTIKTLATIAAVDTRGTPIPVLGGVALDSSGDIFGTTAVDENGSVFEIKHNTTTLTTVATFKSEGFPLATVIADSSGNLFGTVGSGGSNAKGSVYEIAKGTTTVTTLASFNGTNNGATPDGNLFLDSRGNLFGTTQAGGKYGDGTVFEVPQGARTIKSLASFNGTNGSSPDAGVAVDSRGNVFGTTLSGGSSNQGTVYEIASGKSSISTLVNFDSVSTLYGANPAGPVVFDSSGNLFGTTTTGGTGDGGTVFEVKHGSSAITTIADFTYDGATGSVPRGDLAIDSSGDLFGTTEYGGTGTDRGTIFEIAHGTHAIITLYDFQYATGYQSVSGVRLDGQGDLFATTQFTGFQGPDQGGSVIELPHGSTAIKTLAIIPGGLEADVTLDCRGDVFGVSSAGGPDGDGSVFEIANGALKTLATFKGSNGKYPASDVVVDSSGDVFGTTYYGGTNGSGTIFEIKAGSGAVTTLVNFGINGYPGGLTVDASGDLFGTTGDQAGIEYQNSTTIVGTVFEIPHGTTTLTTLATFNGTDGANPAASPSLDANGDIYGTTENGGSSGGGTVFEIPIPTSTPLTGKLIGTSGAYQNQGNGIANVFDGNQSTFFDAPVASGAWVGLNFGSGEAVTQVSFAPRAGYSSRMVGGQIQASNTADFSSGVVTAYTITTAPPAGVLTTVTFASLGAYQYWRYIGPTSSYCNIAELEFAGG